MLRYAIIFISKHLQLWVCNEYCFIVYLEVETLYSNVCINNNNSKKYYESRENWDVMVIIPSVLEIFRSQNTKDLFVFVLGVQINSVRFCYQKCIYFKTKRKKRLINDCPSLITTFFCFSGNFQIPSWKNFSCFETIQVLKIDRTNLYS